MQVVDYVRGRPSGNAQMWAQDAGERFPLVRTVLDRAVSRTDSGDFDFAIIDIPPWNPDAINAAISAADIVFIPTRPSHLDASHTAKLVESLAQAQISASVLVIGAGIRWRVLRDVRGFLTDFRRR